MLTANDLVVYDRGYFSYFMLYCHLEREIAVVFRIQKHNYKVIDEFTDSDEIDQVVTILPSSEVKRKTSVQRPGIKFVPLQLRLIKYSLAGETYTIGTTLMDKKRYRTEEFCDLYHSRWGIEELYKNSKILIEVDDFHSHSERGVKQELFAHFALITINRIFSNKVEKDPGGGKTDRDPGLPKLKVNFKNALTTIARNLEGLSIQHTKLIYETVHSILTSLSRCKQAERSGRSFERRSMKTLKCV